MFSFAPLLAGLWTGVPFQTLLAVMSVMDPRTAAAWSRHVEGGSSPLTFPFSSAGQMLPFGGFLEVIAGVLVLAVVVVAIILAVGAVFYFTRPECTGRATRGSFTCR